MGLPISFLRMRKTPQPNSHQVFLTLYPCFYKGGILIRRLVIFLVLLCMLVPMKTEAKHYNEKIKMGRFKLTAYCPCCRCSKGYGRATCSGKPARARHTIAVDPDVIDIGSKVKIGSHVYTAEDCGSHVQGDHIDIFFDTHEEVEEFGLRHRNVWVVR